MFDATNRDVCIRLYQENKKLFGFISKSPAGGSIQIKIDGQIQNHYALGLITTQLMYMPNVLHDTNGFFRSQIDRIFTAIAPYLPKEEQFSIPRWERMPRSFRSKLLHRIYKKDIGKIKKKEAS